jgi:four helix bundle protein
VPWETNLFERVFAFAAAVMRLYPKLIKLGPQYAHIALQLFRSASGIGSSLEEGQVAASRRDMAAKQAIALREARESKYWLRLLLADCVPIPELTALQAECSEFVAMLTTSVRKLRQKPPA